MPKLQTEHETSIPVAKEVNNIEIWGDHVQIKDLLIAIVICSITTIGGYLIAPNESPKPLIFGLIGGIIGFLANTFLIKPKRFLKQENEEVK